MSGTDRPQEAATARIAGALASEPRLKALRTVWETMPVSEWFLVGGAVRDLLLGREVLRRDYDLMVRNADLEGVSRALSAHGAVDVVGKRFGVLKFTPEGSGRQVDIAWPRTERAGGSGAYRDFEVRSDPALPVERDLARRDFTVNAMAWDVRNGRLLDPHDGQGDLARRMIRAVGDPAARFGEDLTRVFRALRFACELGFEVEKRTWDAIRSSAARIDDLMEDGKTRIVPYEMMAREFVKALMADRMRAVTLFEDSGLLFRMMPELKPMRGCAQSGDHHSEGDVWAHSKLAVAKLDSDGFRERFSGEEPSVETVLATLLHDIGKPDTAGRDGDRITFYGHDARGAELVDAMERRLRFTAVEGASIDHDRLVRLVHMHLFPNMVDLDSVRRTTLERHFLKDRTLGRASVHLAYADAAASIPEGGVPDHSNLDALLRTLRDMEAMPRDEGKGRLITGDDVMTETGLPPGREVGRLLEAVREAQLSGEIGTAEEAKAFLARLMEDSA